MAKTFRPVAGEGGGEGGVLPLTLTLAGVEPLVSTPVGAGSRMRGIFRGDFSVLTPVPVGVIGDGRGSSGQAP